MSRCPPPRFDGFLEEKNNITDFGKREEIGAFFVRKPPAILEDRASGTRAHPGADRGGMPARDALFSLSRRHGMHTSRFEARALLPQLAGEGGPEGRMGYGPLLRSRRPARP